MRRASEPFPASADTVHVEPTIPLGIMIADRFAVAGSVCPALTSAGFHQCGVGGEGVLNTLRKL